LDAYHSGEAKVLGHNPQGQPIVEFEKVTDYNNNRGAGYVNQPTNKFMIKVHPVRALSLYLLSGNQSEVKAMDLAAENMQFINLAQAMLGAITPNFRVVSFEYTEEKIHIWFLLEAESQLDREEIEDIVFEFGALQFSALKISFDIVISQERFTDLWGSSLSGRMVFARNEERHES
jgi:hypothetical protein